LVLVGGRRRPALPGPAAPDLQHVAQPAASTPSTPSPAERLTEGPARPLSGAQAVTLPVPPHSAQITGMRPSGPSSQTARRAQQLGQSRPSRSAGAPAPPRRGFVVLNGKLLHRLVDLAAVWIVGSRRLWLSETSNRIRCAPERRLLGIRATGGGTHRRKTPT